MAVGQQVIYYHDGTELEGQLTRPEGPPALRPGIVLFPEWMGPGAYMDRHVDFLVSAGYTVLLADMYGRGIRPRTREEAGHEAHKYRYNRSLMRKRAIAALTALMNQDDVDQTRLAAAGYSFGGCTALELARSGAPLRGTVSFYGYLETPEPNLAENIRGSLLVFHGLRDTVVRERDLAAFKEEMASAGVDAQIVIYTRAAHGFSNPDAGADPASGSVYDALTDHRSRRAMIDFLKDIFAE